MTRLPAFLATEMTAQNELLSKNVFPRTRRSRIGKESVLPHISKTDIKAGKFELEVSCFVVCDPHERNVSLHQR